MLSMTIQPRFAETDALGHINNTVIPGWFEQARLPIFEVFVPSLETKDWNLILAKIEVEFLKELFHQYEVEIKTGIEKLGTSSCLVYQEVWQQGELAAKGVATMVHFDYGTRRSAPIPNKIREALEAHLV